MGKKHKPKGYKGSEKLRQHFIALGQFYGSMQSGTVKTAFGELLVLAHQLDEECVRLLSEWWTIQAREDYAVSLEAVLAERGKLITRLRSQRQCAQRDRESMRVERDLIQHQHDELLARYKRLAEWADTQHQTEADKVALVQAALGAVPVATDDEDAAADAEVAVA